MQIFGERDTSHRGKRAILLIYKTERMKNQHDKVGNRTRMDLFGGDYIVYGYDETYQLINESRTGSASYQLSWTYDEVGNRLTRIKTVLSRVTRIMMRINS